MGRGSLLGEVMELDSDHSTSSGSLPDEAADWDEQSSGDHPHIIEWLSAAATAVENEASGPKAIRHPEELSESEDSGDANANFKAMASRAYQLEMLQQSLRRNVVVAMDTGTGKTQVAILRIKSELERCDPEKIVWFLAPTVVLCKQQYTNIGLQILSVSMRLLTGEEQLETWRQHVWTGILEGTRIVVSTPAVLRDALDHAFFPISRLTLIVFDEAHNAVGKSDSRKIMVNFYHPQKQRNGPVPSILGLTASPSMRSTKKQLDELEATLDATCVTPTTHREELIQYANRPQISHVSYPSPSDRRYTTTMQKVQYVYRQLDIKEDPYVLQLKDNPTDRNMRKLRKVVAEHSTWSQNQLKGLWTRSEVIFRELGAWAADRYIWTHVSGLIDRAEEADLFLDADWDNERLYVANALGKCAWEKPPDAPNGQDAVSEKVRLLVQELLAGGESPVGIVFVKERVMVSMLREVLRSFAPIREKYHMGTVVGSLGSIGRSHDLFESRDKNDLGALQNFASSKLNLLIATNVLEEGIDVPACNLVICFDKPATAKSFIQRRGRARMRESKLVLFFENTANALRDWEAAEAEMRKIYEDEQRERKDLKRIEDSEQLGDDVYIIAETGARLDYDNAKQHLEHFCNLLCQGEFVDGRPDYITDRDPRTQELRAVVLLPPIVESHLRHAESANSWESEKNATKDAAFHAYKALHQAGLLDDHLLPLPTHKSPGVETREPIVGVDQLLRPWTTIAQRWTTAGPRWRYPLEWLDDNGGLLGEYEVVLPLKMTPPGPIRIFVDFQHTQELRIGSAEPLSEEDMHSLPDHTSALLGLHFKHRWNLEDRAHVLRVSAKGEHLEMTQIGARRFDLTSDLATSGDYFVRDRDGCPLIYTGFVPSKPPIEEVQEPFYEWEKAPADVPYLLVKRWTKRSDFMHRLQGELPDDNKSSKLYQRVIPVTYAKVDTIPRRHAEFGMLIPSVIHELEVMIMAKYLSETLLESIGISDMNLIREAISARSASEPFQYERLEFLGDSILKYCTSVQVSANHLNWPEGYLSFFKDRMVANSRLSRAARETKLSQFILTRPFTGQKWRPLYLVDHLGPKTGVEAERRLSTKTLADVVEALIGACYVDGGIRKAVKCISLFVTDLTWTDVSSGRDVLLESYKGGHKVIPILAPVQALIGYEFRRTSLLVEALTHASFQADTGTRSLERLEFLGDAILDNIIVTRLFAVEPPLPHSQMHMLKTAMVNGDFLAFLSMERSYETIEKQVNEDGELEDSRTAKPLWTYMRHASSAIGAEQKAAARRHDRMRKDVNEAITHGTHYPWALLARLQAKKFYSDMIEALLGAVWIDSGDLAQCEVMLQHLGILPYLDRLLRDKVHVQHPKEELAKAAISEKVRYEVDVRDAGEGELEYLCRLFVGERIVAEVENGVNKEEVKTKAAAVALEFLKKERSAIFNGQRA